MEQFPRFPMNGATVELIHTRHAPRTESRTMSKRRTGTFEAVTLTGRAVYRGRLRLADGTKSDRFDLPVDMTEKQARAYRTGLQAEEDTSHAVFKANAPRRSARRRSTCNRCPESS